MADFRITIDIKDVTEGDVTGVADDIWNTHANDLDAHLGDFKLSIAKVDGGFTSDVDWQPSGD